MNILTKHQGHTCTVVDDKTLRCQTCQHTLQIAVSASTSSTSTVLHPRTTDPNRCSVHLDAAPCRGCAADRKASA